MYVIKKDNTHEPWNVQKVITAVNKSAYRALIKFTQEELDFICQFVENKAFSLKKDGICKKLSGLSQLQTRLCQNA